MKTAGQSDSRAEVTMSDFVSLNERGGSKRERKEGTDAQGNNDDRTIIT